MLRRVSWACLAVVLLVVTSPGWAAEKDRAPASAPSSFQGKITEVSGNTVTVVDGSGATKRFQVASAAKLKKGMVALCIEDCERSLRVGEDVVHVQRVLSPR